VKLIVVSLMVKLRMVLALAFSRYRDLIPSGHAYVRMRSAELVYL